MNSIELKARTKAFALSVIKLVRQSKKELVLEILFKQVIRSSTSVAANYRAACRAKSRADFTYKIGIVLEETDESLLWLELISESSILENNNLDLLKNEANDLTAIFVSMLRSLKGKASSNPK